MCIRDREELGDDEDEEIAELRKRLNESAMPDEARERVDKELKLSLIHISGNCPPRPEGV